MTTTDAPTAPTAPTPNARAGVITGLILSALLLAVWAVSAGYPGRAVVLVSVALLIGAGYATYRARYSAAYLLVGLALLLLTITALVIGQPMAMVGLDLGAVLLAAAVWVTSRARAS